MQNICILGSTGSIGVNTLSVIDANLDSCQVIALTANTNRQKLFEQCIRFSPRFAVMNNPAEAKLLSQQLANHGTEVLSGEEGLITVSALAEVNTVMCAIVGAAGLLPTLSAARAGKKVLLANKEALVMSGELFMKEIRQSKARLIPIDSEHNAIFQCLPENHAELLIQGESTLTDLGIEKILLTGSGGPFRQTPVERLTSVTPAQACDHPNWLMGQKISVDSATMMNKGLEYIEAHWLFSATVKQIDVLVHPQSVIHSMVHYKDGSVLAQLGLPDMRTPIAHGLAWPERMSSDVETVDFTQLSQLTFEAADEIRFPALRIAREALEEGGSASTIMNAANEIAVRAFLSRRLKFTDIVSVIDETLGKMNKTNVDSIAAILDADKQARQHAQQALMRFQ